MKRLFPFLLCSCLCAVELPLSLKEATESAQTSPFSENLVINNRILVRVNNKPITVMDLVRKMDFVFFQQYPEMAGAPGARYQFYQASWHSVLQELIDSELIMADAEEKKVEISDGDIREEMETLFGPEVVLNIEKMGLTYEQTWELLRTDLLVRRMTGAMVHQKALMEVGPRQIQERYRTMLAENPPEPIWNYQTITLRSEDAELLDEVVSQADLDLDIDALVQSLGVEGITVRLSEEYVRKESELSSAHKSVLATLGIGEKSAPVSAKTAYRIFCLNHAQEATPIPFAELETRIKNQLVQESILVHDQAYREKLRAHYGMTKEYLTEQAPQTLELFALR